MLIARKARKTHEFEIFLLRKYLRFCEERNLSFMSLSGRFESKSAKGK